MRTMLFAVHPHYGSTWVRTDPKPPKLATELVRLWDEGYATDIFREVPGRREVRA